MEVKMILSDKTLMKMLDEHSLVVTPIEVEQIQPASIDIRLGNTYSMVEDSPSGILNLEDEITYKRIVADKYILLPGQLVFAQLDDRALHPYRGKYQGQRGATGSKVFLDKDH